MKKLALFTPLVVTLASCGSGGDDSGGTYGRRPGQARVVGVEGLLFRRTDRDVNVDKVIVTKEITETTNDAGVFVFGQDANPVCKTDPQTDKTTCVRTSETKTPVIFSLCNVALPELLPPTSYMYRAAPYTPEDIFSDPVAARNFAAIALMANVHDGDPLVTGIKLSPALQSGTCQDFNWYTANIQQDAASFQQVARTDGRAHEWPSEQALDEYMLKLRRCAQAGRYYGFHQYNKTSISSRGRFDVYIDLDGQLEGFIDFSGDPWRDAFTGGVPVQFSGAVTGDRFQYVGPPTHPILPNLIVDIRFYPNASIGTWTSENDYGTTEDMFYSETDLGLDNHYAVTVPKYRFFAKDITYRRPGAVGLERWTLTIDVDYDRSVRGHFAEWPSRRLDQRSLEEEQQLLFDGGWDRKTNKLTAIFYYGKQMFDLQCDPNTISCVGSIIGQDGVGDIVTFTREAPLRGCRL